MSHETKKDALSVKEVCERMGIGKTLAFKQIKEGRLKTVRIGGKLLVLTRDLEAFQNALGQEGGAK
ncbi:MAG: helix-turn-helix domain-containing protein [Syntrophobacteraceae bacterium]|jgi:excisionase family DNA binding protein|nr:helix-turn-helix domain-containing protein [Syntrophobacteraceae bacterium]